MKNVWNKIESQSFNSMEGEKMKCSQITKIISRYIDHELGPEERRLFELHIRDCSGCRHELEEVQAVHELFASAERFPAPYGFATRVMANLEAKEPSWLWQLFTLRPFFLRTVEVAFALIIMIIGVVSGNLLVADRTSGRQAVQTTVQESFSLDLFQATPPDSVGGAYVRLVGAGDER
jgi:anti-sigma factor RsiW